MIPKTAIAAAALLALAAAGGARADGYPDAGSVVSIGGPVTEIVYALGQGARLVARDTTSLYPPEAQALPDVGYMRQLSAEGVLSAGPDLILARDTSGPAEVLDQLEAASVPVVLVHDGFTAEAVLAAIRTVGEALGEDAAAEALAGRTADDLAALAAATEAEPRKVRALFLLSAEGGRLMAAGAGTGADGILSLAGAENVMAAAFEGYKPVNDEAILTAAPEAVVMMRGQSEHAGEAGDILAMPAFAATPAAERGAFVTVDPAALGFGPRTAEFARGLHDALYAQGG
ncbi:hemin ABC transporter substrate-binding protein [Poseidonocella sp. HB161398]|uniref:heme/hemin ABC transporter substrate-binding protein n=1 Tax=Poseidonocella sp. HB161398 TaxID=2320855 RepID=UPI001109C8FE|nr:ABC transporter substrate-binding protein [Poseidonocella sp. HB161398]